MTLEQLCPEPQSVRAGEGAFALPRCAHIELSDERESVRRDAARLADDLLAVCGVPTTVGGSDGFRIRMRADGPGMRAEGYRLRLGAEGADLVGADPAGLFYAGQTLLQALALCGTGRGVRGPVPCVEIEDWPQYRVRELMLDLGRAPHSMRLLRRAVRIMARLKLNSLHLHLHDDELNGLRYATLPLGSENTTAMSIEDLRQLVAYARQHHVAIVPELEAWGHVGSICYHYPDLVGGPGMWGGYSLALGEEAYELFEKMLDEVVPALETKCDVHLGLDEATWATAKTVSKARRDEYSPERHVGRLYDVLQRVARRHGREARLRIWADHGGRPVPKEIEREVVVEPWMYMEARENDIRAKVATYGGAGKAPFMMGGGMSSLHLAGGFGATGVWCQAATDAPNCEGIDICLWCNNNLAGQLMGVYAGADFAWSPLTPALVEKDNKFRERIQGDVLVRMKKWQAAFEDADDGAIRLDTGPEVQAGFYVSGPWAGMPVAPTATMKGPVPVEAAVD